MYELVKLEVAPGVVGDANACKMLDFGLHSKDNLSQSDTHEHQNLPPTKLSQLPHDR